MGGPRIQVAQPTEGSTAGFPGDDWHPICTVYCFTIFTERFTITVTEYLAVHPDSAPGN